MTSPIPVSFHEQCIPTKHLRMRSCSWGHCGHVAISTGNILQVYKTDGKQFTLLLSWSPFSSNISAMGWFDGSCSPCRSKAILAVSSLSGQTIVYDFEKYETVGRLKHYDKKITSIKFSPFFPNEFYLGSNTGLFCICKLGEKSVSIVKKVPFSFSIDFISIDNYFDGKTVVVASKSGDMQLISDITNVSAENCKKNSKDDEKIDSIKIFEEDNVCLRSIGFFPGQIECVIVATNKGSFIFIVKEKISFDFITTGGIKGIFPLRKSKNDFYVVYSGGIELWSLEDENIAKTNSLSITKTNIPEIDQFSVLDDEICIFTYTSWLTVISKRKNKLFIVERTRLFPSKPICWDFFNDTIAYLTEDGSVLITDVIPHPDKPLKSPSRGTNQLHLPVLSSFNATQSLQQQLSIQLSPRKRAISLQLEDIDQDDLPKFVVDYGDISSINRNNINDSTDENVEEDTNENINENLGENTNKNTNDKINSKINDNINNNGNRKKKVQNVTIEKVSSVSLASRNSKRCILPVRNNAQVGNSNTLTMSFKVKLDSPTSSASLPPTSTPLKSQQNSNHLGIINLNNVNGGFYSDCLQNLLWISKHKLLIWGTKNDKNSLFMANIKKREIIPLLKKQLDSISIPITDIRMSPDKRVAFIIFGGKLVTFFQTRKTFGQVASLTLKHCSVGDFCPVINGDGSYDVAFMYKGIRIALYRLSINEYCVLLIKKSIKALKIIPTYLQWKKQSNNVNVIIIGTKEGGIYRVDPETNFSSINKICSVPGSVSSLQLINLLDQKYFVLTDHKRAFLVNGGKAEEIKTEIKYYKIASEDSMLVRFSKGGCLSLISTHSINEYFHPFSPPVAFLRSFEFYDDLENSKKSPEKMNEVCKKHSHIFLSNIIHFYNQNEQNNISKIWLSKNFLKINQFSKVLFLNALYSMNYDIAYRILLKTKINDSNYIENMTKAAFFDFPIMFQNAKSSNDILNCEGNESYNENNKTNGFFGQKIEMVFDSMIENYHLEDAAELMLIVGQTERAIKLLTGDFKYKKAATLLQNLPKSERDTNLVIDVSKKLYNNGFYYLACNLLSDSGLSNHINELVGKNIDIFPQIFSK